MFMVQDENPWESKKGEDNDDENAKTETFMYFIRTGMFQVTIKSNFYAGGKSQPKIETKYLHDGDHFGEIGLVYNTKRTASVMSKNYGALARLRKSGFNEIQKHFPSLTTAFKEYTFKYKDELRTFLEMESDKI